MRRSLFVGCLCLGACRAPLPEREPPSGGPQGVALAVEPAEQDGHIQPVSRFMLTPADEEALVFRGELSDYHLRKLRERELPKTLSERIVPVQSWRDGETLALCPLSPLLPAEAVSVASPELGLIAELRVVAEAAPALGRVWPPTGASGSGDYWLFCGEPGPLPGGPELHFLEPGHWPIWAAHESEGRCVSLAASAPLQSATPLVPPLAAFGRALEPAALAVASGAPPSPPECAAPELPFGPGCISVADDRAVIRGPEAATLWAVSGGAATLLEPIGAGGRSVLRGLTPGSSQVVSFWVRDGFLELFRGEQLLSTSPPAKHVVLSEVFANPLGTEPAQEWIELYNDGAITVELSTLVLEDGGGQTPLPAFALVPGAFALLVREDYAADDGPDPKPAAGAKLLRVPALGKNGLSNSGEALTLRDGASVVSKFPALPKPKPGLSVARRAPWTLDDDPAGFAHHAPPGASPGAENVLGE